jgi:hypothetical protein
MSESWLPDDEVHPSPTTPTIRPALSMPRKFTYFHNSFPALAE